MSAASASSSFPIPGNWREILDAHKAEIIQHHHHLLRALGLEPNCFIEKYFRSQTGTSRLELDCDRDGYIILRDRITDRRVLLDENVRDYAG